MWEVIIRVPMTTITYDMMKISSRKNIWRFQKKRENRISGENAKASLYGFPDLDVPEK